MLICYESASVWLYGSREGLLLCLPKLPFSLQIAATLAWLTSDVSSYQQTAVRFLNKVRKREELWHGGRAKRHTGLTALGCLPSARPFVRPHQVTADRFVPRQSGRSPRIVSPRRIRSLAARKTAGDRGRLCLTLITGGDFYGSDVAGFIIRPKHFTSTQ